LRLAIAIRNTGAISRQFTYANLPAECYARLRDKFIGGEIGLPCSLERARIAERLGEVARAVEGYQYVAGMWRQADPELQPFVAEARQALGRLTAEPRR
jgi:hypothetical protein